MTKNRQYHLSHDRAFNQALVPFFTFSQLLQISWHYWEVCIPVHAYQKHFFKNVSLLAAILWISSKPLPKSAQNISLQMLEWQSLSRWALISKCLLGLCVKEHLKHSENRLHLLCKKKKNGESPHITLPKFMKQRYVKKILSL